MMVRIIEISIIVAESRTHPIPTLLLWDDANPRYYWK